MLRWTSSNYSNAASPTIYVLEPSITLEKTTRRRKSLPQPVGYSPFPNHREPASAEAVYCVIAPDAIDAIRNEKLLSAQKSLKRVHTTLEDVCYVSPSYGTRVDCCFSPDNVPHVAQAILYSEVLPCKRGCDLQRFP